MKIHPFRQICFALAFTFVLLWWLLEPAAASHARQMIWQRAIARADNQVQFLENLAELDFPNSLTFSIRAMADESITALTLEYGTNATSCVRSVARQPVEIEPGKTIEAEWTWDFKDSGSLPMGAQVWWEWEAVLSSGEVARSERQTQTIIDQRYTWEQTGNDPADITSVNIWYHDTRESFARELAAIGQKALQRMQAEFKITPANPVQIILYNNSQEVFESGLFFAEWTGGYAVSEYSLVVIGVEPGDYEWAQEVINHEFGHMISGELTANCLAVSMPTWLSEGFSMYAEGGVASEEQDKIKKALAEDTLPPLHTLAAGFAANDADARRSYAHSGMVIEFLVKIYGAEKLPRLFAAIQAGTLAEDGLREVYNLDVDALDNAWRASLGFAGQQAPPTPTATSLPTTVPTLPLFAPYEATSTPKPTPMPTSTLVIPASPTATVTAEPPASPASAKKPILPCLGGNAMILGLFLALLYPAYRSK